MYIVVVDGLRVGDIVYSYCVGIFQDLLDSMGGIIDFGIFVVKIVFKGNCFLMYMIFVGIMVFCVGFVVS